MTKQGLVAISSVLLAVLSASADAADRPVSGFYGGVTMRDQGVERGGMSLGIPANALSRFSITAIDDSATRSLLYGGYKWANDIAVEASVNSTDPYTLRSNEPLRRGVGLLPSAGSLGMSDIQARSWNVDLYTSWNFLRSFSLYGRLGYAQTDLAPTLVAQPINASDARRLRDGVNYGVGVRYDLNSALGLRVEYGRFGRFAGEVGGTPLESDQVTFGLQFRF